MKKKINLVLMITLLALCMTGCKKVQIFEKEYVETFEEVSSDRILPNTYYVKNGTKFSQVYMPMGNCKDMVKSVRPSRVLYFTDNEYMLPTHYKGEIVAYASTKADLSSVVLERFEDMGYTFGFYGGYIGEDGYYHLESDANVVPGSDAESLFNKVLSTEIRITKIGEEPISKYVDEGSGIITSLEQDEPYVIEFYAGTYYYRQLLRADTHMFRAYEMYLYDKKYITDTTHGYRSFNTPENLKSGYYNINGSGLFKYYSHVKGVEVENENMNEGYYANKSEMVASYSQQYNINVPQNTKNMEVVMNFGEIKEEEDFYEEITGYVIAPDGSDYYMDVDKNYQTLSLNMTYAQAGDWVVNIIPKSLEITNIKVDTEEIYEETSCEEVEFVITEDETFQMFYATVDGDTGSNIYGSIIGPDYVTYNFDVLSFTDENRKQHRYLQYKLPYMKAGTYTVKIYYYKSKNTVKDVKLMPYDSKDSDILIVE